MSGKKEWYVIYTKPRWEKKVFEALQKQEITAYCPLNRTVKQWSDRKKIVEVPLFSSYVFVQILPEETARVRMTPGVVNFLYWLGEKALIRDHEIEALRTFVSNNEYIIIEPLSYREGDNFEIKTGPFTGQKAVVRAVKKKKTELVLESLNLKLVVTNNPVHDKRS